MPTTIPEPRWLTWPVRILIFIGMLLLVEPVQLLAKVPDMRLSAPLKRELAWRYTPAWWGGRGPKDFSHIDHLSLEIPRFSVAPLRGLELFTGLRHLDISPERPLQPSELAPLRQVPNLRELWIQHGYDVQGGEVLPTLQGITSVEELVVFGFSDTDLEPLRSVTNLRMLALSQNHHVTDLTPLADLPHLKELELFEITGIRDLSPLARCTQLERVQITGVDPSGIADLRPLLALPHLKEVTVDQDHPDTATLKALRVKGVKTSP
ncbi:MAG TPA: leucine-rich repeat domain-containing protein [bacterium]|nr:leucine-rich repeat domain-containing protein [bacterium]